jgi:hypothetical protein
LLFEMIGSLSTREALSQGLLLRRRSHADTPGAVLV